MFAEQLIRIRNKLERAKAKDIALKHFGSEYHRYEFYAPLSVSEVKHFEQQHSIQLPADYISLITNIGNGGPGPFGGAGPYCGLYALGEFGYMVGTKNTLALPCLINTQLTRERWHHATSFAKGIDMSKAGIEFDRKYDMLFSGLLPIGSQGSSFQTMLVLNGDIRGCVVSIDQDLQMPKPAPEKNFLDWYEDWLDHLLNHELELNYIS